MTYLLGVNLIPGTGEFGYDVLPYEGEAAGGNAFATLNLNHTPGGAKTDYSYALDQLQADFPALTTVALVVSWFGDSLDLTACHLYPSTNFIGGAFKKQVAGSWTPDNWLCSSLTQNSAGLIPISTSGGSATYGGTPSDQSIVRCIEDLKGRGLRVVFYPFILMDVAGLPWRGRITFSPDVSAAATAAVDAFLGSATAGQFTRDATNLTVAYAGSPTDWTLRRMILHYANLVCIAGGVDLFLMGSELRGIETIRGPAWTKAGTLAGGRAVWDYPFVAGLIALADDVRAVFDGAGLATDLAGLNNLVAYSADWSDWMGYQHPGENGQWPHLDQLWAHGNIDLVSLDNYMPLSDWTTGAGGLDAQNWDAPAPTTWPPASLTGLGLAGQPMLLSKPYLKANIEGGEKFGWFYADSDNAGRGFDPNGSDLQVSLPEGDRATQTRNAYFAGQEILANKQLRWWWNNPHYAVYDTGGGFVPQGAPTQWNANSKSLSFAEYGVPTVDKGTNQPNVFYDPASSESFTPYWSIWDPAQGSGFLPRRDDTLATMALQAVYEYWVTDGHNPTVGGVPMIQTAFLAAWNWDARPFPTFPLLASVWGDAGNWSFGQWIGGKGPYQPPPSPPSPPSPGTYETFPALASLGWSVKQSPTFATGEAMRVSGRSVRAAKMSLPTWDIELTYAVLRTGAPFTELEQIIAFYAARQGQDAAFLFAPPGLSPLVGEGLGSGDGVTTTFPFTRSIGAYTEALAAVGAVSAMYVAGVRLSPSDYTLDAAGFPATVTFNAAPALGARITADFAYDLLCRFADDFEDVEEFIVQLFRLQSLKLVTVKL